MALALLSGETACGGISDPTKGAENVATVSGSLTGTSVPANARVALVWRTASSSTSNGGYAVGDDVAVIDGKFSMNLAVPSAAYFSEIDDDGSFNSSSGIDEPSSGGTTTGSGSTGSDSGGSESSTSSSGGSSSGKLPSYNPSSVPGSAQLTPRDNAAGGVITNPLSGAVAGFVVYVDTNANGRLDLSGQYAASSDTILGGNKELVLAYLKDGGALDYEKLRDTSGILPLQGFNLAWTNNKRWLPLNEVELKLDATQGLPSPVCSTSGSSSGSSSSGSSSLDPVATTLPSSGGSSSGSPDIDGGAAPDASAGSSYPSPTDPNLSCAPDGLSFTYTEPSDCTTSPPAPTGLCAVGVYDLVGCAPSAGYTESVTDGTAPPAGWPCPIPTSVDGGSAPDGG